MLLQGLRRGGPPPGGAPERQRLAGTFLKGQPALLVGHCGARTGRPRPPTAERQAVPGGGFVQTGAAAPVLRGPFSLVTSQESSWRTVHAAVSAPPALRPPAAAASRLGVSTGRDAPSKVSCCRPSAGRARGPHVWASICSILDLLVPVLPRWPRRAVLCRAPVPPWATLRAPRDRGRPPRGPAGAPPAAVPPAAPPARELLCLPVVGARASELLRSRRPLPPPRPRLLGWPLWPQLHTRWPQKE